MSDIARMRLHGLLHGPWGMRHGACNIASMQHAVRRARAAACSMYVGMLRLPACVGLRSAPRRDHAAAFSLAAKVHVYALLCGRPGVFGGTADRAFGLRSCPAQPSLACSLLGSRLRRSCSDWVVWTRPDGSAAVLKMTLSFSASSKCIPVPPQVEAGALPPGGRLPLCAPALALAPPLAGSSLLAQALGVVLGDVARVVNRRLEEVPHGLQAEGKAAVGQF